MDHDVTLMVIRSCDIITLVEKIKILTASGAKRSRMFLYVLKG